MQYNLNADAFAARRMSGARAALLAILVAIAASVGLAQSDRNTLCRSPGRRSGGI
jgi:hypothetical protein